VVPKHGSLPAKATLEAIKQSVFPLHLKNNKIFLNLAKKTSKFNNATMFELANSLIEQN